MVAPVRRKLKRPMRLADKTVIARLLKERRREQLGAYTVQAVGPSNSPFGRLALAVSKRHLRRAVDRNRIKRQVREAFRQHSLAGKPVDLLVSLRSRPARLGQSEGRRELRAQLAVLLDRVAGRG